MNCTQPIVRVYRCDIGNALLTIVCAKHGWQTIYLKKKKIINNRLN